jgi:protein TonB
MKTYLFILMAICCSTAAIAQKQKIADPVKIKKQFMADSIKHSNQIYTRADINPTFPGGDNGLLRYVKENMQYPTRDREDNTQGKAYVRFVVEKDGSISNVKTLSAPSTTIAMEAERLVKNMPKWTPGIVSGGICRVQFTIAVNFTLQP